MTIGSRDIHEDRVQREHSATEERRRLRQERRDVFRPALVHRGPCIRTDEERSVVEVANHLWLQVWPRSLDVEVDHLDVL